jgi:hypothetical protein
MAMVGEVAARHGVGVSFDEVVAGWVSSTYAVTLVGPSRGIHLVVAEVQRNLAAPPAAAPERPAARHRRWRRRRRGARA